MENHLPSFENGLFIQGVIDQSQLDRLTREIIRIKFNADPATITPITFFVDSPGGSPFLASRILDLARARNPGKPAGFSIAYVTGRAASAASDLTIQADYSYMAPGATMLCHGTSQGGNQAINVQTAESIAASLRQDNEFYARQLAEAAFFRQIFIFSNFGAPFQEFLANPTSGLSGLIDALKREISSRLLHQVLGAAVKRQQDIRDLTVYVGKQLAQKYKSRPAPPRPVLEATILKAILDQKLRGAEKRNWNLGTGGLEDLNADFRLLHDYHFGDLNEEAQRLVSQYGKLFLLPAENMTFNQTAWATEDERINWLKQTTLPRIRELWYFSVSLARLLQEKDFEFDAYDAYWLGLVNEVVGANLPCVRLFLDATRSVAPLNQT